MRYQYNLATRSMSQNEITKVDKAFAAKGWDVIGTSKILPENFRTYQWNYPDRDPDFPAEYAPDESQTEPIVLPHFDGWK